MTGSSQGIGAEIARLLHRAGARVVLNHPDSSGGQVHRDAEALRDELSASRPDSALVVAADVSDPSAVEAMMQRVATGVGRPRHPGQQRGHPPRPFDRQDDARRVASR